MPVPPPPASSVQLNTSIGPHPTDEVSLDDLCISHPHFQVLLEQLRITRGPEQGEYKCFYCKVNKKKMISRDEREDWMLTCECSNVKGVMKLLMKEMGILSKVIESDITFTQMARSISQAE